MNPRNTGTGRVLEQMVLPALAQGGYQVQTQVKIGNRPGGKRHVVDVVAKQDPADPGVLISLKWQQRPGTVEQKVPFEVICLIEALRQSEYRKAYLVLAGPGWSLRDFYTSGGLAPYLVNYDPEKIIILPLDEFVARANQGQL